MSNERQPATKADLARLESSLRADMATKADLESPEFLDKLATCIADKLEPVVELAVKKTAATVLTGIRDEPVKPAAVGG